MRPLHDLTAQLLRASHSTGLRVAVSYDGATVGDLPIAGGTVTLDLDSEDYASAELQLADPSWLATGKADGLLPYGHRLRVSCTVRAGSHSQTFDVGPDLLVTTVPTAAGILSTDKVRAGSLVQQVRDARFVVPRQAPPTAEEALAGLLGEAVPGAPVRFAVPDRPLPGGTVWERERWDAVKAVAAAVGAAVRPEADGFAAAPEPQPAGVPVWTVDAGPAGVLLHGAKPEATRDGRWNAVVVANPDDPAVWAIATLDDGPLAWDGPFGRRPYFWSSPLLATPEQAQAAADTRLANLQGTSRRVEVRCIPNPALEPGDIITVVWPDQTAETMMIRRLVLPLAGGDMRLVLQGGQAAGDE